MNSQKWLSLLVVLIILYSLRQKNIKFDSGSEPAKPGYYSLANNYQNVSSLKLDIFKQLTADLFFILIIGKMDLYKSLHIKKLTIFLICK